CPNEGRSFRDIPGCHHIVRLVVGSRCFAEAEPPKRCISQVAAIADAMRTTPAGCSGDRAKGVPVAVQRGSNWPLRRHRSMSALWSVLGGRSGHAAETTETTRMART